MHFSFFFYHHSKTHTIHIRLMPRRKESKRLLLTCPRSVQFQAVSRSLQLQTQDPIDGERRQSGRHGDRSDPAFNTRPPRAESPPPDDEELLAAGEKSPISGCSPPTTPQRSVCSRVTWLQVLSVRHMRSSRETNRWVLSGGFTHRPPIRFKKRFFHVNELPWGSIQQLICAVCVCVCF